LTFSTRYDRNVTLAREGAFMRTAVIILGHGSRSIDADTAIRAIVQEVMKTGEFAVAEHAFLQYVPPSLQDVLARCIDQNVDRIVIVPFFLQAGTHVTRDIPALVERARNQYPSVDIIVTGHVGAHPLMARIVEDLVDSNNAEHGSENASPPLPLPFKGRE
jgi:sirohydrochlorin ferrochelatase